MTAEQRGSAHTHEFIEVRGARENNLRDVSLDIPKRGLTVFTGVSGSGKSSLVFGTIAAESRRLINETYSAFIQMFMTGQSRPDVDSLRNLSAAIVVDQERMGANSRSTVGTATDVYSMMRTIFSRIGTPHVGGANMFSFNDPSGMCPACEGLGQLSRVDIDGMVDRRLSLDEGAITFPGFAVDSWGWRIFAHSGFFDTGRKLCDYTDEEWDRFLHGPDQKIKIEGMNLTYEGLIPKIRRLYLLKDVESLQPHIRTAVRRIATFGDCPDCGGGRLNPLVSSCRIDGHNIADWSAMQASDLAELVAKIDEPSVRPLVDMLSATLNNLIEIGLGYLSMNRQSASLSGGEAQRVKMVRHLGSSLTDVTYVFDEPTVGLHPHDIDRMNELLKQLRDKGNTVLVVEHKPSVIAIADHVVDLGPGAGVNGGRIVYEGPPAGLRAADSITGRNLGHRPSLRSVVRQPRGRISIRSARRHNLRDIDIDIPTGVLVAVTGVAGSGKSSLIHGHLPKTGEVTVVDQGAIRGSRRSNPATYTGMLDPIRKAFAKATGAPASLFSANSDGACPECKGIGLIYTDLAFMAAVATVCEACEGRRFTPAVLEHRLRGRNIGEVLAMPVEEAAVFFTEKAVRPILSRLIDVGLPYLTLGQPLNTLSGGERQRLKLAIHMATPAKTYVLDEPTSGLHMADVARLVALLHKLVDDGAGVITIEHNLDVVAQADWVIDIGPGAGHDGGTVVFEGTPAEMAASAQTYTAQHLRAHLDQR